MWHVFFSVSVVSSSVIGNATSFPMSQSALVTIPTAGFNALLHRVQNPMNMFKIQICFRVVLRRKFAASFFSAPPQTPMEARFLISCGNSFVKNVK